MKRPLTEQMREYLAALYWSGSIKGYGFGPAYDSTRKALVGRGLLRRRTELRGLSVRHHYELTEAGIAEAKTLPDPRATNRDEPLSKRLEEVKAGRW